MKKVFLLMAVASIMLTACNEKTKSKENKAVSKAVVKKEKSQYPDIIKIKGVAQNPEGIEFDKNDQTFYLSSLNAGPIIKVNLDSSFKAFTSGEKFPLSTAGIQIDYKRNRLLVAGFNGTELMDKDPKTKGTAFLRIYNLKTGVIEKDINLSSLLPNASAYFANDIAIDNRGNAYISDWYARVVYKVDLEGNPIVFWKNETGIASGANGLDFHPDGYLLVSVLNVNDKGLYTDYGLVKIPLDNPAFAKVVNISKGFTGFDGMVINKNGNVVGITNNGTSLGGNTLIELSSTNAWKSAKVINSKAIPPSTTLAVTPDNRNFVINQDFTKPKKENWTIQQVKF